MPRQFWQSGAQFMVVFLLTFFQGMLVNPEPPDSWAQLLEYVWQPAISGAVGALGIWSASKIPAGGKE